MKREELEHLLRAAGDICKEDHFIVIGSQAILGQFPNAPECLRVSVEADVIPAYRPERTDLIDGTIGELSPFHATYGYYAHGVSERTAVLPEGWRERLIAVCNPNTRGVTGLCLEVHDLLVSKLVAGREKDHQFVRQAILHRLATEHVLLERLEGTPVDSAARKRLGVLVQSCFRDPGS